jgi:uncharacterized protein (DUF488 family)
VFLELLQQHRIRQLADVRAVPASRRHPQFGRDRLASSLAARDIAYRHFPSLGGLRKPQPNSVNTSWRHEGFRGYADYMQTEAFNEALQELIEFAKLSSTVIMCAEVLWWQCHRQLLADALLVRDVPVQHILPGAPPKPHRLTDFARLAGRKVIYPGLL